LATKSSAEIQFPVPGWFLTTAMPSPALRGSALVHGGVNQLWLSGDTESGELPEWLPGR
jgi:hypothetical protein